jgi:hypothetical protein
MTLDPDDGNLGVPVHCLTKREEHNLLRDLQDADTWPADANAAAIRDKTVQPGLPEINFAR